MKAIKVAASIKTSNINGFSIIIQEQHSGSYHNTAAAMCVLSMSVHCSVNNIFITTATSKDAVKMKAKYGPFFWLNRLVLRSEVEFSAFYEKLRYLEVTKNRDVTSQQNIKLYSRLTASHVFNSKNVEIL